MNALSVVVRGTGLGIALQAVVAGILHNLNLVDLVYRENVIMIVIMSVLVGDATKVGIVWIIEMGMVPVIATAMIGTRLLVTVLEVIDLRTGTPKMDMVGIGTMKGMEALEVVIGMLLADQPGTTKEASETGLTPMMLLAEAAGADIIVGFALQTFVCLNLSVF